MTDLPEAGAAPARPAASARFLGHSTFELDLGVATVLTDPVLRHRVMFLRRTGTRPAPPRPRPTVVLVSHLHHDHFDVPSLAGWALGSVIVVPQGSQRLFRRHGFPDVVPLSAGESHRVGGLTVTATPARHSGRREPFGPTAEALGFLLEARRAAGLLRRRHRPVPRDARARRAAGPGAAAGLGLGPTARLGAPGPGARRGGRRAAAAAGRHTHALGQPRGDRPLAAAGPATGTGTARSRPRCVRRGLATDVRVLAPGTGLTRVD